MHIFNRNVVVGTILTLLSPLMPCVSLSAADEPAAAAAGVDSANRIAVPPGLTLDDAKAAVLEAAAFRKWQVLDQSGDKMIVFYNRGHMSLTLTILCQTEQVTIEVKQWDSNARVAKTQGRWLNNIRKDISDALVKRKALKR
jgi:hypothetical protein